MDTHHISKIMDKGTVPSSGVHFSKVINAELDMDNCWLLSCTCGTRKKPTYQHKQKQGLSLIQVYCTDTNCRNRTRGWLVCKPCILQNPCPQRFRMQKKEQIQKHILYHQDTINEEKEEGDAEMVDVGNLSEKNDEAMFETMVREHEQNFTLYDGEESGEGTDESNWNEFYENLKHKKSMRYLVSNLFSKSDSTSVYMDEHDAEAHVIIASLTYVLGKKKNNKFARLFELIKKKE